MFLDRKIHMATEEQVKRYLAHWFQLGKKVLLHNGQEELLPKPIFLGNSYSYQFENCWQRITAPHSGDCYLEGTNQTIQELLSSAWDIIECARCQMLIPISNSGNQGTNCPCFDLPTWPNTELPLPHFPVDNRKYLSDICQRLRCGEKLPPISSEPPPDDGESHR